MEPANAITPIHNLSFMPAKKQRQERGASMFYLLAGVEIAVLCVINQLVGISDSIVFILVGLNGLIIPGLLLLRERKSGAWFLMSFSLWIRSVWLIARVYLPLPDTALGRVGDAVGYQGDAVAVSQNLSLLGEALYGQVYSKVVGVLYSVTGTNVFIGEYLNIILSLLTAWLILKIVIMQGGSERNALISAGVFTFIPWSIIVSVTMLRESLMILLVALSHYFFAKWIAQKRGVVAILLCVGSILGAATLHAGTIVILPVYLLWFAFYKQERGRLKLLSPGRAALFGGIIIVAATILKSFGATFLGKLWSLVSLNVDRLLWLFNYRYGRTAYLVDVQMTSLWDLVWALPLRLLYFICSPFPWDCENVMDWVSFFLDALIYIMILMLIVKAVVQGRSDSFTWAMILVGCVLLVVYSMGTFTAGTAMRHRHKALPALLIALATMKPRKETSSACKNITDSSHSTQMEVTS